MSFTTTTSRHTFLAGVLALAILPQARAATCYSWYRGNYECGGGLGSGARWGVGIGIAAAVLILSMVLSLWVRKRRLAAFRKNAQTLPTTNTESYPSNYQQPQTGSSYYTSQYQPPAGAPPLSKPPQAYQPSSAGQYGGMGGDREHDYEYQQAEENRRMEEQESGALPPPAYDAVAGNKVNPNCA
ncbi:hypothetical protein QFC20_000250 [Naganishia adeliensis]|uniref:Uncharacterized protein n=1 Tax=Naganishia adeliensis TaxID=92952 RepID=A0ACC2X1Q1_9TREE|nr:hypothetical protein QFC20_000250 [Naganishia adeliensis]